MEALERQVDSTWFEEQIMRILPDLFQGALSMADRRVEAEDLVAEAVARAWERRDDLREPDRFRGWVFCILRNCFRSRLRKRAARPEELPLPEDCDEAAAFSLFDRLHQPFLLWWGNPEQNFLDRLLKEDLEEALSRISEPYREVVALADVHEFRYAEIAEALEIPVGTVRSRLARGRARLQEELWEHAVDAGLRRPRDQEQGEATE